MAVDDLGQVALISDGDDGDKSVGNDGGHEDVGEDADDFGAIDGLWLEDS
jgi:hypothetical protein